MVGLNMKASNDSDLASFNALIACCGTSGHPVGAEMWMEQMVSAGVRPDLDSFNGVIQAHATGGRPDWQQQVQYWVARMHMEFDQPQSEGIASGDVAHSRPSAAKAHKTEVLPVPEQRVEGFCDGWSTSIKFCAHKGEVARAEALVEEMRKAGQQPTVATLNSLIHACTQSGDVARAERYLEAMESGCLAPAVVGPDVITYNSVINACAAQGETERAEAWLSRMIDAGLAPTDVTYGTICKAFARQGNVSAVERIMAGFEGAGRSLNEYFFASLISACGAASPPEPMRAERALADLQRRGLRAQSVRRVLVAVVGDRRAAELLRSAEPTARVLQGSKAAAAGEKGLQGQTCGDEVARERAGCTWQRHRGARRGRGSGGA